MNKSFLKFWNDFFNFTKAERNASFVLIFLIIFIAIAPYVFQWVEKREPTDFKDFDRIAKEFEESSKKNKYNKYNPTFYESNSNSSFKEVFVFNPNSISEDDLLRLGFKKYIAQRIVKYRDGGGKFKIKNDLKRIFGIDTVLVNSLLPYIDLPEKFEFNQKPTFQNEKVEDKNIVKERQDLNTCDSIDLVKVFGIGPTMSNRILKYRNRLGGFYDFAQLNEVYNLKPEVVEELRKKFVIKSEHINKLKINSASFTDLIKHPYLTKNEVNVLLNYRKQHGNYNSMEDIGKTLIFDDKKLQLLKNYFEF